MHEKDDLDRMLESSLSSYGDAGAEQGLAERILARVASEQRSKEQAPGLRNRVLLWAALPAAACLLLTLLLLKSAGPPGIRPSIHQPNVASVTPTSEVPVISTHRQTMPTRAAHLITSRSAVAIGKSAGPPKLDVFPLPRPLSPEERALYAFATQVPEEQRQAVLAAQKNDDAPLNIAAIHIQPLEMSDPGKN
ncbi:hypothetical protein P8935_06690 [Telmatobacter sp. DSM 110680]|uniref:Uncharacterized protein n=1 Tax=Telmatobacter sp. DSM 110680 TaxID=3036704 RepID=A0AAU7DLH6_9BACT